MIGLEDVLKTSWTCFEDIFARRLGDALKTWRLGKASWRILEDILKTFLQHVLKKFSKTSCRRLGKTSSRRLEDVWWRLIYWSWPRRLEDVFWRCMTKVNSLVLIKKTFFEDEDERRFQDIFKTSSSRGMFAGLFQS